MTARPDGIPDRAPDGISDGISDGIRDSRSAWAIDLNADVGELPQRLADGREAALIQQLSSVNIACGGHAGDADSMRAVLAICRSAGVAVGAHPSYPDRAHFGRLAMDLEPAQLIDSFVRQVTTLAQIAKQAGMVLSHVKPHGALYHQAADDLQIAETLLEALRRLPEPVAWVGRAGSRGLQRFAAAGVPVVAEGFADRRYVSSGTLLDRRHPEALLSDADAVAAQAVALAQHGRVRTQDWIDLSLSVDTLCLHSDTQGAESLAGAVRAALQAAGATVRAPRGVGSACLRPTKADLD